MSHIIDAHHAIARLAAAALALEGFGHTEDAGTLMQCLPGLITDIKSAAATIDELREQIYRLTQDAEKTTDSPGAQSADALAPRNVWPEHGAEHPDAAS
jgi:hypothetical protein